MKLSVSNVASILTDFDTKAGLLRDFRSTCHRLTEELLRLEEVRIHSVTSRVKDRVTIEEKLTREGKEYGALSQITDVVGIRIITYFEDDVDKIGELIKREFQVDASQSIDKRQTLAADQFGYLSLHFVCGLSDDRLRLSENRRFETLACEIQIRSILQHAWAEIEHDLGYKSEETVPVPVRRRFSRLAGLLELADKEFREIRDVLEKYEQRVSQEIVATPAQVTLDSISLQAFIETDELVQAIDSELLAHVGATFDSYNQSSLNSLVSLLRRAHILTVEELKSALVSRSDLVIYEFKSRVNERYPTLAHGISVWHLALCLLAEAGSEVLAEALQGGQVGKAAIENRAFSESVVTSVAEYRLKRGRKPADRKL